jgi:hypothetical protein
VALSRDRWILLVVVGAAVCFGLGLLLQGVFDGSGEGSGGIERIDVTRQAQVESDGYQPLADVPALAAEEPAPAESSGSESTAPSTSSPSAPAPSEPSSPPADGGQFGSGDIN